MAKSKLAVIQDDILAVKHALANDIEYEGLKGQQLNAVLSTLVAQRAQEAAATAGGGTSSSAASPTSNHDSSGGGSMSRVPVNASRPKAAAVKKSSAKSPTTWTSGSASKAKSPESTTSKKTPSKSPPPKSKASKQLPPPPPQPPSASPLPQGQSQGICERPAAKKRRSFGDVLRQLRKSIKVGDHLSVLMDLSLGGSWEKAWVKGEVIREVSHTTAVMAVLVLHPAAATKS